MSEIIIEVNKLCRACLKLDFNLKSINAISNCNIKLIDMINYLIENLELDNKDYKFYPENICVKCEENLILSYNFKKQYEECNKMLYSLCKGKINESEFVLIKDENINLDNLSSDNNDVTLVRLPSPQVFEVEAEIDHNLDERESVKAEEYTAVDVIQINENSSDIHLEEITATYEDNMLKNFNSKHNYCKMCNITFQDLNAYQSHYEEMHRTPKLCPLCGKLVSKKTFSKHMSTHSNKKDHLCTECGKMFTLRENLKKHWRIHTGDKRYICEICGEKFIHWNSKRSHIRTFHTGEKKYECSICGEKFAQSSNMFRHIRRSHTGELPHECSYCSKKFGTSPELKNHLVVHTKERNHICDICKKAFGTKKSLRSHIKIHTGEKNYICPVCSKAFTQAHVLRTHMKTHPNYPIPPPGVILSKKVLKKRKITNSVEISVASTQLVQ